MGWDVRAWCGVGVVWRGVVWCGVVWYFCNWKGIYGRDTDPWKGICGRDIHIEGVTSDLQVPDAGGICVVASRHGDDMYRLRRGWGWRFREGVVGKRDGS
jgi:hypothetical protein